MNNNKPITTLYMLMPVDGKISTGAKDELDVDKDFPTIEGLKEGLHQYYKKTCEKTPSDEIGCGMNHTSFSSCIFLS